MNKPTYVLGPLLAEVRDGYRATRVIRASLRASRRAVRAERKSLERELAGYTSPSDLADLEAILARYSDEETAEIRDMLRARR